MLTLYGVGTLVGGGFYALIGKVAGLAGPQAPVAVLVAGVVALFSALTFCELAARFPFSGGPARYVQEIFGWRSGASVVGWVVVATGLISAATLSDAVVGFVQPMYALPTGLGLLVVVGTLTAIAAWGIGASVGLAVVITLLETGGLLYVVWVGRTGLGELVVNIGRLAPGEGPSSWIGIMLGAFLAFYSFVGFEDLVTMSEEVKDPTRNVPRAVILSLAVTLVIYVAVVLTALASLPPDRLATADNPLVAVLASQGVTRLAPMALISVLAGVNGALVQIVMASRVIYGLAGQGEAPALFAWVHPKRQTPLLATCAVGLLVVLLAWFFPIVQLARFTSFLLLLVFMLMHVALAHLKLRGDAESAPSQYPLAVQLIGTCLCVGALCFEIWRGLSG